jgi:hypothetical protein
LETHCGSSGKAPPGSCEHPQLKDGFKKSLSMSGEVWLRWRATKEFRMSDPDRLTSCSDIASAIDKQGLILRIIVVAFLAAIFWHTVVATALP